jgi:putative nucleotidyltransferase with HDIG domain
MNETLVADFEAAVATAQHAEREGRWLDALSIYDSLQEDSSLSEENRAQVLRRIGSLHFYRGDLDQAAEQFLASCKLARAAASPSNLASALNCLGNTRQAAGRLDEAEQLFQEAQKLADACGHGRLAVMAEQNLGIVASIRGDVVTALTRYQNALQRYEADGDIEGAAWVLNNLGMVRAEAEQWQIALDCYERALSLSDQLGDADMVATVNINLATLHHRCGKFDEARVAADRAFAIFTRLDSKQGLGEVSKLYGMLYRDTNKLQLAEAYLQVVVDVSASNDFMQLHAEADAEYALVHQALGRSREALRALNNSHDLFSELKASHRVVNIEQQLDRLERKYLLVTKLWGESIESKDHYTAGHCGRVADYACRLAEAAGFSGRDLTWIRMGGFLHDVGKTAIDPAIINKTERLTEAEWEEMKAHTTAGDAIVAEINFPWDIRSMVRNHHEHWDGTGYPDQLAGDAIPRTARILCIADVYDALTTDRSYRRAHTPKEALEIMKADAGKTLDPVLLALFERAVWPGLQKT